MGTFFREEKKKHIKHNMRPVQLQLCKNIEESKRQRLLLEVGMRLWACCCRHGASTSGSKVRL